MYKEVHFEALKFSKRHWGVKPTNSVVIPQSLVLMCFRLNFNISKLVNWSMFDPQLKNHTRLYLILRKQHSVPLFLVSRAFNSRKGQRTNQKYRNLVGSAGTANARLEETELRKADRMVGVNCYIFQYFVRHGLTSSGNVYN